MAVSSFELPAFSVPYPVRTNPHYSKGECDSWVRKWLSDMKVEAVIGSDNVEKLVRTDAPRLVALFDPDVGQWQFFWICKYFLLLFVVDDILDESNPQSALDIFLDVQSVFMWSFPDDPILVKNQDFCLDELVDTQLAELKRREFSQKTAEAKCQSGSVYPGDLSMSGNLFRDLWADALQKSNLESLRLLAHFTQEWLIGSRMEMPFRNNKKVPSSSTLIKIRRMSSACKAVASLVDITYAMTTPVSWFYTEECQTMIQAMNDFVTWHNDIWSFKKEVLENADVINIVLVLSVEQNISYAEAGNQVLELLKDCITRFEVAAEALEDITPPDLHHNFVIYKEACRSCITGTHEWHDTSYRMTG